MPRNNYSALPELSSLVRWTVQDVINWLDKNKLSSCAKVFREAGIDGNKLYNSTEADLSGIGCPRKDLVVICDLIKQAQPQKGRGAYKQPVPNIQAPPRPGPAKNQGRDDDSGSDDDCMWSDNEFSDEDDGNDNYLELDNPVPPPSRPLQRGQRRPSYQDVTIGGSYNDEDNDSDDSSYEQPISDPVPPVRPSKNFSPRSGGSAAPQPSVPGRQQRAPPPVPQDNHIPDVRGRPQLPGLRPQPSPPQNDDNEEFYEEPDKQTPAHSRRNVPQPPLPVSSNVRDRLQFGVPERPPVHQSPKMGRGRKVSPPQEEVYEDPDEDEKQQAKGPQKPRFKAPAPPSKVNPVDDQEHYEQADDHRQTPSHPGFENRYPRSPLHHFGHQQRSPFADRDDSEFYVDPEECETNVAPPPPTSRNKRPGRPLPNVPKTPVVDDDQEFYEDPEQSAINLAPPPPTSRNKRPGRPLPNVKKTPVVDDVQEFYVDPDECVETNTAPSLPTSRNKLPGRPLPTPVVDDDDQEFYVDPEDCQTNVAPPPPTHNNTRSGRQLPNVPKTIVVDDDQEEFYMDPDESDEDIPPSNLAPPPPTSYNKQSGRPQANITNIPVVDDDQEEFYVDPDQSDEDVAPTPPPPQINKSRKPQKPNFKAPAAKPSVSSANIDDQELYVDPEECEANLAPPPPTSRNKQPGRPLPNVPKTPVVDDDQEEFYMDPDQSDEDIAPTPPPPQINKSQKPQKPNFRAPASTPAIPSYDDDQELYNDPEESDEDEDPHSTTMSQKSRNTSYPPSAPNSNLQLQDDDSQIDYEEADQPQPPPSSRHVPRPKPAAQPPQEDYEVLDRPDPTPPVPRLHPSKQHKGRAPAPIPADDDQDLYEFPEKPDGQEEDYEQPDLSGADPSRFSHQRPGISILPTRTEPKHHPMKNSSSRSRGDPLPPTPKNVPSPAKAFNSHAEEPKGNKSAHGDNDESDLDRQKWYHGDMKRAEANSRLMRYKVDGMYLIRKSTQGQDRPYTMQIFYQGKDFNLPIRLLSHNNQYALGAHKAGETTFPTLRAMVNFFKKNFLVLAGGYQTTLVQSLPKS